MDTHFTIPTDALRQSLPVLRGRVLDCADLAAQTWFRVGGPAQCLIKPADAQDLGDLLRMKPADIPLHVIGVGSNLLIRDGGIDGVVVRLGRGFAGIEIKGDLIHAGAGALDSTVAAEAAAAGLGGLEFLSGIPGTIGGGLRMNAGAYGTEFKDVLVEASALDPQGILHRLRPAELAFGYRHCGLPEDWIFLGAVLRATPCDPARIARRMADIRDQRQTSQPVRSRTGGSTFANPAGMKAWELIDRAGCRGLRRGGAMISELHANFLINLGDATAQDIESLGEEVRRRVLDRSGVLLQWEIRRIGKPLPEFCEAAA